MPGQGNISFSGAEQSPGGGGGITGATNGLRVIGSNIGLGGTLDLQTVITTLNSSTLQIVPTAGEENPLLALGPSNNWHSDTFLNVFSDITSGFQQKAIYISDKSAPAGEGFIIYYDTIKNGLQIGSTNNTASFNITNAVTVIGTDQPVDPNSILNVIGDQNGTGIGALFIGDKSSIDGLEIFYDSASDQIEIFSTTGATRVDFASGGGVSVANGPLYIGQSGSVDPSALVQIDSNTKGFLLPRMSQAERLAIATPAIGLMVYQTDTVMLSLEGLYINKSTGWTFIA